MPNLAEILRKKAKRKELLETSLESIIDYLKKIGAQKIILFGSVMEDKVDVDSDLDLLVIMPSNRTGKDWMDYIYSNFNLGIAADIIVYNNKEYNDKFSTSSFLKNIIKSGRIIYEKT